MLARFAILRLQLVLEGEPGPQRRVRRTPTLLQAWTAVLLQEQPLRSAMRSRDLVLAQLLYNIPALLEDELARDRDAQILPKERLWGARTCLQSRKRLESKKVDVRSLDRSTRKADLCVFGFWEVNATSGPPRAAQEVTSTPRAGNFTSSPSRVSPTRRSGALHLRPK